MKSLFNYSLLCFFFFLYFKGALIIMADGQLQELKVYIQEPYLAPNGEQGSMKALLWAGVLKFPNSGVYLESLESHWFRELGNLKAVFREDQIESRAERAAASLIAEIFTELAAGEDRRSVVLEVASVGSFSSASGSRRKTAEEMNEPRMCFSLSQRNLLDISENSKISVQCTPFDEIDFPPIVARYG